MGAPELEHRVTVVERSIDELADMNGEALAIAKLAGTEALAARQAHHQGIKLLNALRSTQIEQGAVQAEHSKQLADHGRQLADHGRQLADHGRQLGELRSTQRQHTGILEQHSKTLDQHTKILNQHTEVLDQHTNTLSTIESLLRKHFNDPADG
ncbi:hypothetical protein [Nocardia sp. NPDC049149]|uniref:hypothetical protein n=1 Tax=Nocardia sp. NPDC049149 TaxID=3364315 RepID=UPI00371A7AD9